MTVLLDSVILIDHFDGATPATDYLRSVYADAAISLITRAEVLVGFSDAEQEERALPLLNALVLLPLTREDADEAARLRRQHRWKLPDAFQAALARRHGLRLATRNTKDFHPEHHPFVSVPYEL